MWVNKSLDLSGILGDALIYFIAVAITEEGLKFAVVYFRVLRTTQLDEPIDAMIYMIIAALGFAAIENILLLAPLFQEDFAMTLKLTVFRFLGATLLHVLASAIIGYYLAISLRKSKLKIPLLIHGFTLAILVHGFYNILVTQLDVYPAAIYPIAAVIKKSNANSLFDGP
mgnify:CR=1 FL=1